MLVVGTSGVVFPAAELLNLLRSACATFWRWTGIVEVRTARLTRHVRGHWR